MIIILRRGLSIGPGRKKSLITSKHDLFFHSLLTFMASGVECMRTFCLLLGKCVEKITEGGRRVNEITWIL